MATINTYSFQEEGQVIIGSVTLNNVTNATVKWEGDREESERISAGDKVATKIKGPDPSLRCTLDLELYDETGVDADLNKFLRNTASGKNQVIILRPWGTGAGKKERILQVAATDTVGMELTAHEMDYPTGKDNPATTGKMTWTGDFERQVGETTQ